MPITPLAAQEVRRFRDVALAALRPSGDEVTTDAARIDLITELEHLKSAACALQAELSVDLDASVRSRDARQGVAPERRGRGVAAQIAHARQESPHRGSTLLGLAKTSPPTSPARTRRFARAGSTSSEPKWWPRRPAA